jgi:hypothetical protein
LVTVVRISEDKGPIGGLERVGRYRKGQEAGHGREGGAMSEAYPTDGAETVASRGSVNHRAVRSPVEGGATGLDSGGEEASIVGEGGARDRKKEGTQGVGAGEQDDSVESAQQPRESSGRRVNEAGSRQGEVDAVDGGQSKMVGLGRQGRDSSRVGKDGTLMHGATEGSGSVQARAKLETKLGSAGDEGGNGSWKERLDEGEGDGCGDHDEEGNAVQRVRTRQSEGKRRDARVD